MNFKKFKKTVLQLAIRQVNIETFSDEHEPENCDPIVIGCTAFIDNDNNCEDGIVPMKILIKDFCAAVFCWWNGDIEEEHWWTDANCIDFELTHIGRDINDVLDFIEENIVKKYKGNKFTISIS